MIKSKYLLKFLLKYLLKYLFNIPEYEPFLFDKLECNKIYFLKLMVTIYSKSFMGAFLKEYLVDVSLCSNNNKIAPSNSFGSP